MAFPHYTVSMTGRQAVAAVLATALVAAAIGFAAALMSCPARAHDDGRYATSSFKPWFAAQYNAKGEWCCDKSDGHAFYGDYKINDDGSVEFDDGGQHHKMDAYMVLRGPNPTGHAVWWHTKYRDYCFALGSGG